MNESNKPPSTWIPEIMYEGDSQIPFIEVPDYEQDPSLLFIFINRKTGESEPGQDGEELPVYDMDLRQYADLKLLKDKLTKTEYDKVRAILGLKPLIEAAKAGSKITSNIRDNLSKN